jgi:hypothetical protein
LRSRICAALAAFVIAAAVVTAFAVPVGAVPVGAAAVPAAGTAAIPRIITASTAADGSNPGANIKLSPGYPRICRSRPTGAKCQRKVIAALNHARAVMGLPAYNLPAGFQSLAPTSQFLVLSNLDRASYGLTPITGLNATLNRAATTGIAADNDPRPPAAVNGVRFSAWTANWAAGWASGLYTYYEWMYEDGPGGANADCSSTNSSGCWTHRSATLRNFGNAHVAMGAASGTSPRNHRPAFTEIFESFPRPVATV